MIVDLLRRQLDGALAREEPFPHAQFQGPSGVGKTRLANALALEYGTSLIKVMGNCCWRELADKLGQMKHGDFLFIDESHRLGWGEQEMLMQAIDHRVVPKLNTEEKPIAETRVSIPPWTLILATDQPGRHLDALLKRIVITIHLDFYTRGELKEIVEVTATELNLLLSPQAARLIAEVSRGLPRQAEHHLSRLRLHFANSEKQQLGLTEVREYLRMFGIDENGLGQMEQRYLVSLAGLGSASIGLLAMILGTDIEFLRKQIEINLVRLGYVKIIPSGRRLTEKGQEWLRLSALDNITINDEKENNVEANQDGPPADQPGEALLSSRSAAIGEGATRHRQERDH